MNLVRKSFSKHHCPKCGARVAREKSGVFGGIVEGLIFYIPYVFVWLVCAGLVVQFGGNEIVATVVSVIVTLLPLNPIFFRYSDFLCGGCESRFKYDQVVCKGLGWGL
jgi:hypothetical protein